VVGGIVYIIFAYFCNDRLRKEARPPGDPDRLTAFAQERRGGDGGERRVGLADDVRLAIEAQEVAV
jgi:hypothetical protein